MWENKERYKITYKNVHSDKDPAGEVPNHQPNCEPNCHLNSEWNQEFNHQSIMVIVVSRNAANITQVTGAFLRTNQQGETTETGNETTGWILLYNKEGCQDRGDSNKVGKAFLILNVLNNHSHLITHHCWSIHNRQ